ARAADAGGATGVDGDGSPVGDGRADGVGTVGVGLGLEPAVDWGRSHPSVFSAEHQSVPGPPRASSRPACPSRTSSPAIPIRTFGPPFPAIRSPYSEPRTFSSLSIRSDP